MEMVSSEEGQVTDAAILSMLRRETQELADQVSKKLKVQMHKELQSVLKQLQATLNSHSDGCRQAPEADLLRMSGLTMQAACTEPPRLSSGDESSLLSHHRRGYVTQKEIANVLAKEDLDIGIKNATIGRSRKQLVQNGEHDDEYVYYHTSRSGWNKKRTKTFWASGPSGPHSIVKSMVGSLWFDALLGVLIVANAIWIGFQTDWNVKHRGEEVPIVFRITDLFFCATFTIELCLRLCVHRMHFYFMKGWGWNLFDTFIILAQVLEESLITLERTTLGNLSFMRIVRVFRLVRIIRLVRLLRLIGELRLLVCSFIHSLKSLFWTVFLTFLIMYIGAVWLTQLVADQTDRADDSKIFYYYGTLIDSILSLFQSITSGIDWDVAMRPLVEEIDPLWGFVYCFYISLSVFAMLNVVTGVVVEAALHTANQDKEVTTVCTMGDFFKKATGGNGTMSWRDFKSQLHTQNMQDYFKLIDMDVSEARAIFRLLDLNQTGSISVDEFLSGCVRLRGSAKAIDLVMLMHSVRRIEEMLQAARSESLQHFQRAPGTEEQSHDSTSVRKDCAKKVFLESSSANVPTTSRIPLPHAPNSNTEEEQDKMRMPCDEPHWLVQEV